jgi:hypothetical protein
MRGVKRVQFYPFDIFQKLRRNDLFLESLYVMKCTRCTVHAFAVTHTGSFGQLLNGV